MVYYLGSKNTLGHYANTKLLDGDPQKIEVADVSPDAGFDIGSARAYPAHQGRPVRTEHVPTRVEWQEKAPIPDVETQHGMLVVPELFRDIVEQFEPGVHQFLPVQYVDRAGSVLAKRFYFVPCNRIDSVDRSRSTMVLFNGRRWRPAADLIRRNQADQIPQGFDTEAEPKIVFNADQIGAVHAWCDKHLTSGIEISDALALALSRENFSGILLKPEASV